MRWNNRGGLQPTSNGNSLKNDLLEPQSHVAFRAWGRAPAHHVDAGALATWSIGRSARERGVEGGDP